MTSMEVWHTGRNAYTVFSAQWRGLCVASVFMENTEDIIGDGNGIYGDLGRQCGGLWYYSGLKPFGENESFSPACFWMGDDHGGGRVTGFQVRWEAFSKHEIEASSKDPAELCNPVDFGLRYERKPRAVNTLRKNVIPHDENNGGTGTNTTVTFSANSSAWPAPWDANALVRRQAWMASELVVSDVGATSARELCASPTAMGPDFAHVGERLFCDMGSKTLYPFCDAADAADAPCFDHNVKALTSGARRRGILPRLASPYTTVHDWRFGNSTTPL